MPYLSRKESDGPVSSLILFIIILIFKQEQKADGSSLTKMDCSLWPRQVRTIGRDKNSLIVRSVTSLSLLPARTGPFKNVTSAYLEVTIDESTGISCDVSLIKI